MFKFLFERDTWQEVFDSFSKNKLRSILTMVGVWWGILLLIGLLGSAKGLENSFNRLFGNFATNSVFVWGQNTSKPFKGFQEGKQVRLTLSDAKKVQENVEGIEFVLPRSQQPTTVTRNFLSGSFQMAGDYPLLDQLQKKKLIHGRFINQNDIDNRKKIAVISEDAYKQLFEKDEDAVGKYIEINGINFIVVGVFEVGTMNMGPSTDLHIPFTTFQQIYNLGETIGWMMITGKSDYNIKQIEEDAKLLLKNLNNIHPKDARAFGSFNLGKEFSKVTGFLIGMQFLTWFVGIATLIAGVFAIGNILLITVKERTKEIGVRRAIGATPWNIKGQIILEAIFLTVIAGIIGIVFGVAVMHFVDVNFGENPQFLHPGVGLNLVLAAFGILIVVGVFAGLIPAARATQIKPVDALRADG